MNDAPRESWDKMVAVGRVARAHGKRGEVIVNLETDFPERRFRLGAVVYANFDGEVQACRIRGVRFHGGRPLVALDGVDTMNQAEALANLELRVPEQTLAPLPSGTYYEHDLMGCEVRTVGGAAVGTVTAVRGAVGATRLVVREPSQGDEIEVPLAEPICVQVDPEQKTIVVDPPDGLLELNRRQ